MPCLIQPDCILILLILIPPLSNHNQLVEYYNNNNGNIINTDIDLFLSQYLYSELLLYISKSIPSLLTESSISIELINNIINNNYTESISNINLLYSLNLLVALLKLK